MIKPFQWTHPLIFSLPARQAMALQAPFPMIAGLNTNRKNFEKKYLPMLKHNEDAIVVFLEEFGENGEIEILDLSGKEMNRVMYVPNFGSKKDEIGIVYEDFRAEFKNWQTKSEFVWKQNEGRGQSISFEIQKILKKNFIENFPVEPVYKSRKSKVSLEENDHKCRFLILTFMKI
jgi:hypothetical protein